jgi:DNA repair protein RadC
MQSNVLTLPTPEDRFCGIGADDLSEVEGRSVVELALAFLASRHRPGETLENPTQTKAYLRLRLSERVTELFGCVFLDNRHRVLAMEDLFAGTVDGASVHPRAVVQRALALNAAAAVAYHNHPSGLVQPSQADSALTRRLKDALALVDVRLLDHLVVGAEGSFSFAEQGWL